jgi:proteasome accessory factor A
VDVQRAYLKLVREFCPDLPADWAQLVDCWEQVLDDLDRDPLSTANRLDWAAKFKLIDGFRKAENLKHDDPWLQSLDLSYHLLDNENGLFYGLMDQGAIETPYPFEAINSHCLCPPSSTRAAVRGRCIERFGSTVQATQWDYILVQGKDKKIELDLRNLFDPNLVRQSLQIINRAKSVEDLLELKFAKLV